ncbi:MAG: hypothetical protein J1F37_02495 [Oscillospiraceae bacterium]|nr:hypothetical protein [Oscillospiraceae bacterium]
MTREKQILSELFGDVLNGPTFSQMTDEQLREYMVESARLAEVGLTDEERALLRS